MMVANALDALDLVEADPDAAESAPPHFELDLLTPARGRAVDGDRGEQVCGSASLLLDRWPVPEGAAALRCRQIRSNVRKWD